LTAATAVLLVFAIIIGTIPNLSSPVSGAYTSSSTDADGNTHLASNTVNDTTLYDTSQDSSPDTQQQLGIDPNWQNGITRKSSALKFDGSDDYVTIPDSESLRPGSGSYTVEMWIKPINTTGYVFIKNNGSNNKLYVLYAAGMFSITFYSGSTACADNAQASATANAWQHLAYVINQNDKTLKLYKNGSQAGSTRSIVNCPTNTGTGAMTFAANSSGSSSTSAYYDEARISNTARYTTNFTPSRRLSEDANTVGLWHFDEGSCEAANPCYVKDSSQYANTGTLMNGASNSPAADGSANGPIFVSGSNAIMDGFVGDNPDTPSFNTPGGKTGAGNLTLGAQSSTTSKKSYEVKTVPSSGLQFDGSNDYTTQSLSLNSSTITFEAWVRTSTVGGAYIKIIDSSLAGSEKMYLDRNGTKFRFVQGGTIAQGATTISVNQWYHVAGVYNSAGLSLYINGALDAFTAGSGSAISIDNTKLASNPNGDNYFWTGQIDEVRISNTARYTSNFTPSRRFATDASTVGLWHLDDATGTTPVDSSGNGNTGTLMNGSTNSPAADGTTNGPLWTDGVIPAQAGIQSMNTSSNWALPGYQFRQKLNLTNNVASILAPGYGVESTTNRGTLMDNNQMRSDGNDTRIVYQPALTTSGVSTTSNSNESITIPANVDASLSANYTFELWFKKTDSDFGTYLFSKGNPVSSHDGFGCNFYSQKMFCHIGTGTSYRNISGSHIIDPNIWYHLAISGNGSANTLKMYLNGQLDGSATYSAYLPSATDLLLMNLGTSYGFGGIEDEFRISNIARYNGTFIPRTTPFVSDANTVGLWHLDEGSGTIAADSSGNQNNGVFTNSPTWSTDGAISTTQEVPRFLPHGHTVSFNGTSSYVTIPNNASLNTTGDRTYEAWLKTNTVPTPGSGALQTAVSKDEGGGPSNPPYQFGIADVSGTAKYYCAMRNSSDASVSAYGSTVSIGTWAHLGCTYTNGKLQLYIDGVYQGSSSLFTAGAASTGALIIGRQKVSSGSRFWNGQIDEVRVSSRVRYRSNFTPQTTPFAKDQYTAGLWHMDDGTGNTVIDQTGTNNGDMTGHAGTWVTNGGKVDSINQTQFKTIAPIAASSTDADYYLYYGNLNEKSSALSYNSYGLKFDGSDDYIAVTNETPYRFANTTFTVSTWFKTASASLQTLVAKGDYLASTGGWGVKINAGIIIVSTKDGTGSGNSMSRSSSSSSLNDGNWHQVSAVITTDTSVIGNNTISIYIDGSLNQGSLTQTTTFGVDTVNYLSLGVRGVPANYQNYLNGQLDDVRIYSRSISATEASALYTNTPYVSNSGLVGWWKLDDTTAAGTTAVDSSGSGNNGTLTNFGFNSTSNWVTNNSLLHATTEPTVAAYSAIVEQETPVFYQYRGSTGGPTPTLDAWSTRQQISSSLQQLGATGIYVRWNPQGNYSTYDTYRINALAIESFGTTRGKLRSYPSKTNLVANNGGLDIIDASTNKLWARFAKASNNLIGSNNTLKVKALNGRIYVASADGLTDIRLDDDTALRFTSSGNSIYQSTLANRGAASAYPAAGGTALNSTTVNDISPTVIGTAPPKQYVALATASDLNVLNNLTGIGLNNNAPTDSPMYKYAPTASDTYTKVFMTNAGTVYGANTTHAGLDVYTAVNADTADQVGTADVTYSTASTPALRSNTINSISVTTGTSLADNTSNTVALGTNLGVETIQEHSTQASGFVEHYVNTGSTGTSNYNSKSFGNALMFDGTDDYVPVAGNAGLRPTVFTIEMWFNTTSGSSIYPLNYGAYGFRMNRWSSNGTVTLFFVNQYGVTEECPTNSSQADGVWHHVAGTIDQSNLKYRIFVDGTLRANCNMNANIKYTSSETLYIGSGSPSAGRFNGPIDEVRISNSIRYSGTVLNTKYFTPTVVPFTTDANTIGLWHLDERYGGANGINGQTVYDSSGNANNGTLGADATVTTTDPMRVSPAIGGTSASATSVGLMKTGDLGEDLTFDGSDYVITGSIPGQSAITESFWIKTTTNSGGALRWAANRICKIAGVTAHKMNCAVDGTDAGSATTTNSVDDGAWHHIVLVSGASSQTIYMDGMVSGTATETLNTANGTLEIGRSSAFINGSIDDVRIYSRAITGAEVAALYNGGLGRTDNPSANILGWWKLNEGSGQVAADSSGLGYNGTLGANSSVASDDPTWSTGSPVKNQSALWVGTASGVTSISLATQKQIVFYTTANSSLPSNSVSSLGLGLGGLAIVGTDAGAWPAGLAGFPVDDTASTKAANYSGVRVNSGSVRVNGGGTVRVK
jgi:hypothetical protein